MKKILGSISLLFTLWCSAQFVSPEWKLAHGTTVNGNMLTTCQNQKRTLLSRRSFPENEYAGRFIQISCEVAGEKISSGASFDGGKLLLSYDLDGSRKYFGIPVAFGTSDWKTCSQKYFIPSKAKNITYSIGFQNATGVLKVRNFKTEVLGTSLDFSGKNNMSLIDTTPGDGKGGWSDEGPSNDGRSFQHDFQREYFGEIPFHLIPNGKSVMSMKSQKFTHGIEVFEIVLPYSLKAGYLYLFHTLTWEPATEKKVGEIMVRYADGKTQIFPIRSNKEIADWWNPRPLENAVPACYGTSGKGGTVALYISRFKLNGKHPRQIVFRSANSSATWIIAGATLTEREFALPVFKPFVVKTGKDWFYVPRFPKNRRISGSALDVSAYLPKGEAGSEGFLIEKNGHFVFEKNPGKPVRFLINPIETLFTSKEDIDICVAELRKNGYNMVRTHFFDGKMMQKAKKDLDFSPEDLDLFDYMIAALKRNGIYLIFDCMTSWNGYAPGPYWKFSDRNMKKNAIYFDDNVKENWRRGVEILLGRKNKYTGMRNIEDPVLAMAIGFNEQEYGFIRQFDEKLLLPYWHAFLRKRYKNSIIALKRAWGNKAAGFNSFDEIPCFLPQQSLTETDSAVFLRETEENMLCWYRNELRKMGYRGLFSNYNMSKNLHYNVVRSHDAVDFVTMNSYHAHPGRDWKSQDHSSAIGSGGRIFRDLIATRIAGKPFVITEHNIVYWNRYRYEQGFLDGAYSAFQDIDGIAAHAASYSVAKPGRIDRFQLWQDPINLASEFLTFFAFVRGDVKPSGSGVRISINTEEMYQSSKMECALSANQSSLGFITRFSSECIEKGRMIVPLEKNEIRIPHFGFAGVRTDIAGFSETLQQNENGNTQFLESLKKKKMITVSNRSDGSVFESSTGELFMDPGRKFLSVNTSRMQGVCMTDNKQVNLNELKIDKMSTAGCLAVVAMDGMKPLKHAGRIVLVYSTQALNNEMSFTSRDMSRVVHYGNGQAVMAGGEILFSLKNSNASFLHLYALDLSGKRHKEILPVSVDTDSISFRIHTVRDALSPFFEINVR